MADTPDSSQVGVHERQIDGITEQEKQEVSEQIIQDYQRRKAIRENSGITALWADIDRQVSMKPIPFNIDSKTGRPIRGTEWMPFIELPLQAQALELLESDSLRLLFPDDRNYFSIHADADPNFLGSIDPEDLLAGPPDAGRVDVTLDNLESILEGAHTHLQNLYGYRRNWSRMLMSALKYGELIGRGKMVRRYTTIHDESGVLSKYSAYPAFIPCDPRTTYFEDHRAAVEMTGMELQPSVISVHTWRLVDLKLTAIRGGGDPFSPTGGWLMDSFVGLEAEHTETGTSEVISLEGDLVVERGGGNDLLLANVCVLVAKGMVNGKPGSRLLRLQFNQFPGPSYIRGLYHENNFDNIYAASPLSLGNPLQKAATQLINRLIHVAILQAQPPVSWEQANTFFASRGGPLIEPGASWMTGINGVIQAHKIGDIEALLTAYGTIFQQFQDTTGASQPRLGAQTKSHQTAFAVDTEVQRGVVRTVDFVTYCRQNPMARWLHMEYFMLRKFLGRPVPIYVPKLRSYVKFSRALMPEHVTYDVEGVAGPIEELQRRNEKQSALKAVVELSIAALQAGQQDDKAKVPIGEVITAILEDANLDVGRFTGAGRRAGVSGSDRPAVSGVAEPSGGTAGETGIPPVIEGTAAEPDQ